MLSQYRFPIMGLREDHYSWIADWELPGECSDILRIRPGCQEICAHPSLRTETPEVLQFRLVEDLTGKETRV